MREWPAVPSPGIHRVLVTGVDGYLGCLIGPELMRRGYDVIGVDTGFYKDRSLYGGAMPRPLTIAKDIRRIESDDLLGIDAVIHMAELSNDPAGELSPAVTADINHRGSVRLATLAKAAGVKRFVYMSSCSVYGVADRDVVDETSPVNPQTSYALCKVRVERDVTLLGDDSFAPTFLRNATAYGASPRMRFDIVLNNLAGLAWTTKRMVMTSDGSPWRPLVHALDICAAVVAVVEAPVAAVCNQVFNVGDSAQNYRVRDIATIIGDVFPNCSVSLGPPSPDNRSYRVAFEKIRRALPAFACTWDATRGARQLLELFRRVDLTADVFENRTFNRLKQLQHLIRTEQIDANFYWRD